MFIILFLFLISFSIFLLPFLLILFFYLFSISTSFTFPSTLSHPYPPITTLELGSRPPPPPPSLSSTYPAAPPTRPPASIFCQPHGGGPTRSSPTGHGGCPDVARWPTMEAAPREARPPAIDPPLRRLPLPHLQRGHRRPSSTTHGGRLAQSSPDDQGGSLVKVHLGH
jgi:hypothetical protein